MKTGALFAALILGIGVLIGAQDGPPANGVVRGEITFEGSLRAPMKINVSSDPGCAARGPQLRESPEDVIIYARPLSAVSFPIPSEPVVLEFRDCQYTPRTLTLRAGQNLLIRNTDNTAHNAHAWPTINKPFNVSLMPHSELAQVFALEESPFPIRDDIHNWESAYIGVFSHPYYAVAKLKQAYRFSLPPGKYEIGVWHEQFRSPTQQIEARAGEISELNWILK